MYIFMYMSATDREILQQQHHQLVAVGQNLGAKRTAQVAHHTHRRDTHLLTVTVYTYTSPTRYCATYNLLNDFQMNRAK